MKNIKLSSLARTIGVTALSGAFLLGGVSAASANAIPDTSSSVDPGPAGDFNWNGANWEKRSWTGGPHYNGQYSPENVSAPDANGHVKLSLTNPTGTAPVASEFFTTKKGWGYGTYSTVIEKDLSTMGKEVVWGCMFTYDHTAPPGHNEIDVCEASAWGGGSNIGQDWPVTQAHGYWYDATNGGNEVVNFPVPTSNPVQTHRMVWEQDKLTYETFAGEGFTGTLLKKTVFTGANVPEPANEAIHFNLWVTNANSNSYSTVDPETVTIRDFSFVPLGETVTPEPISNPTIKTPGDVLAVDKYGVLWNYQNPVGKRERVGANWHVMDSIHVTDWDQDGIQDIIAKHNDGKLYFYKGKASGMFDRYHIGNGWQKYEVNVAKFKNSDKYPSIIARHEDGGLYNYPNPSGNALGSRTQFGSGWQIFNNINVFDYDKDGNVDILGTGDDGQIKLYRTNGNGGWYWETRRTIGHGWQYFTSMTTMNGYNGSSNAGIVAKTTDGKLWYYESGVNTWKPRVLIGGAGWQTYKVADN